VRLDRSRDGDHRASDAPDPSGRLSRVTRSTYDRPSSHDPSLIRVRRTKPICLFDVAQLLFGDLDQFVSAVHPAIVRPLRARITLSRRPVRVEDPCCSDRGPFARHRRILASSAAADCGASQLRTLGSSRCDARLGRPQRVGGDQPTSEVGAVFHGGTGSRGEAERNPRDVAIASADSKACRAARSYVTAPTGLTYSHGFGRPIQEWVAIEVVIVPVLSVSGSVTRMM
jgi:hypothetical protein